MVWRIPPQILAWPGPAILRWVSHALWWCHRTILHLILLIIYYRIISYSQYSIDDTALIYLSIFYTLPTDTSILFIKSNWSASIRSHTSWAEVLFYSHFYVRISNSCYWISKMNIQQNFLGSKRRKNEKIAGSCIKLLYFALVKKWQKSVSRYVDTYTLLSNEIPERIDFIYVRVVVMQTDGTKSYKSQDSSRLSIAGSAGFAISALVVVAFFTFIYIIRRRRQRAKLIGRFLHTQVCYKPLTSRVLKYTKYNAVRVQYKNTLPYVFLCSPTMS